MTDLKIECINNLKTLFIHLPETKATSIQVWFRAGSALEDAENQGIAHFLEHMFFKGTKKRPDNGLAKEVDSFGGEFNAFTSFDYTCYYINAPRPNLLQSVDILIDMVSDPQFLSQDLPAEREVVQEEYKRSQDNPQHYNFHLIQKHSFPHGYKHPILGTTENISKFSLKQLNDFRSRFYSQANAIVVVAGDLSNQEELNSIKSVISKHQIPKGKESSFPKFELSHEHSLPIWAHHKKVKQATITLNFQAPHQDEEHSVGEDLSLSCFGHGETSQLHQRLVKKKSLCSHTSASTSYFHNGGLHSIRLVLPEKNISKVFKELRACIDETLADGMNAHVLNKIKNQYIASKVYEYESIESLAFSYGSSFAQSGDIEYEKKYLERIKKCEIDEINSSINKLFQKECYIHVQLPEDMSIKNVLKECQTFYQYLNDKKSKSFKNNSIKMHDLDAKWSDPLLKVHKICEGITLVYRENKQAPTFSMHTYIKGGQGDETSKTAGSHYLLSKSIVSGYGHLSYLSLKKDLDFKSASLYGFSGKNSYGLMLHGLSEHFSELSNHFFGTLLNSSFDKNIFAHEKELIFRAIKNSLEDPSKRLFSSFNKTFFKNFPHANDIYGTKNSLKGQSTKSALSLHQKHLHKDEIVIGFSGALNFYDVLHKVQDALCDLKPRKKRYFKKFHPKILKDISNKIHLEREQTHLFYATHTTELNTNEEVFLKILTAHLSGQSSELFLEMRDRKGLCYSVAPIHQCSLQAGFWGIYMGTGSAKYKAAIEAIDELFKKLSVNGLTENEFNKSKSMLKGQKILNLQTNDDFIAYFAIPTLHSLGTEYETDREQKIDKCDLNEFNRFLSTFLRRKKILTLVGPL